jgi:hypothetical protein
MGRPTQPGTSDFKSLDRLRMGPAGQYPAPLPYPIPQALLKPRRRRPIEQFGDSSVPLGPALGRCRHINAEFLSEFGLSQKIRAGSTSEM